MAIIKCQECDTEISDKAEKCPKCACPVSNGQTQSKVQTIQQTSKKFKKQILFAILAIIIGVITLSVSGGSESGAFTFGMLLTFGGIIWFIIAKIMIWWHHK